MLVDTHAHLTDKKFKDVQEVIERARKEGVEKIIVPSINLEDSKRAIELAEKHEGVSGLVGVHPGGVSLTPVKEEEIVGLVKSSRKVVGIGEIGLDCFWRRERIKEQVKLFQRQLKLAVELDLPVAIHMREAEEEMREALEGMSSLPKGQFHCWSGGEEFLRLVLDKGFYVSFGGKITYPGAKRLRELVKLVPLDRLLLETDSPYLTPEPERGRLNEPKNVKIVANFIANLLDLSEASLIEETTKNALCLFSDI